MSKKNLEKKVQDKEQMKVQEKVQGKIQEKAQEKVQDQDKPQDKAQSKNLFDLPLEVREKIYENLFSQDHVLHLPEEPNRATIDAARSSNNAVRDELIHWESHRRTLLSIKKRYTKCVFTVSPNIRLDTSQLASPDHWPNIKDIEIVIDDLALQKSHDASWTSLRYMVHSQVSGMKADLTKFAAWVRDSGVPLNSVRIRFTHSDYDAPVLTEQLLTISESRHCVLWHFLFPLLRLPACVNSRVEQTEEVYARIQGVDEGLFTIEDLGLEYEVEFRLAVQGWLRRADMRKKGGFDEMHERLADLELDGLVREALSEG